MLTERSSSTLNGQTSSPHPVNSSVRVNGAIRINNTDASSGDSMTYFDVEQCSPESQCGVIAPARNPRLFYEAAFIAKPKLISQFRLFNAHRFPHFTSRNRCIPVVPNFICPKGDLEENGYHSSNGLSSSESQSPASSLTRSSNGTSTPESLKGNLRKENSIERREKKHVQFNLKDGCQFSDGCFGPSDCEEEAEMDDIERSLMQGFSEYGHERLTAGHSRKKPDLTLNLGAITHSAKGEAIDTERALDQQTWYFGAIGRQEAEDILRNCTEGCYIVRSCELRKGNYSLAIKSACGFMHLKIHRQADDLYRLADFNRVFLAVPDLIEYYSSEKLPIKGAEYMRLLHPVHQQLL